MFYYEIGSLNKLLFIITQYKITQRYGTGKKKLSSNAVIILCFHFFCRYLEYYKKIIESSDDHYPINYKSNFIYAKRKKQNKKMPYNNTFDLKL